MANLIEQYAIDMARELRLEHKLTIQDFAMILGTPGTFIGNVENKDLPAKYNLKHINLLAQHFGISPKYFLPKDSLKY